VRTATTTRSGFTLIEVLLTLTIMAGILVTVARILVSARTTRDTIHNMQEIELAGPAILQRIEDDLRALLVYDRDERQALRLNNRTLYGFDADSLDFVCTTDGLMPFRAQDNLPFLRADVNEVGYRLRPNPSSDDFLELYRREDFGVDDEPFEGGSYALLHDRVKGFEIRAYSENGVDAEPEDTWGDGNDEFTGLPAWIEIELTIELAPRLVREQIIDLKKTVTYRRVFRFPPAIVRALELAPVPVVPRITTPVPTTPGGSTPPE
jgi:prepilin-type N-terminal cleavage/methylation domain-containing protein